LTDEILCGAEYRAKPDNLQSLRENAAKDIFLAWGPSKNVSLVLSWVDQGNIATKPQQRGVYVSVWLGI
jgi:Protein of unknown function (DUF3034)